MFAECKKIKIKKKVNAFPAGLFRAFKVLFCDVSLLKNILAGSLSQSIWSQDLFPTEHLLNPFCWNILWKILTFFHQFILQMGKLRLQSS